MEFLVLETLSNIMCVLSLFLEENQMVKNTVILNVDNLSKGDKGPHPAYSIHQNRKDTLCLRS